MVLSYKTQPITLQPKPAMSYEINCKRSRILFTITFISIKIKQKESNYANIFTKKCSSLYKIRRN